MECKKNTDDKKRCPYFVAGLMQQSRASTEAYAFRYKECDSLGVDDCPYELRNKDISKLSEDERKKWIALFDSFSVTPENILHKELSDNQKLKLLSGYLDGNRTPLHKEEERIIYTEAFRRLQYKTQVMINSESDDQRTRLLHSLEVQKISRKLSIALKANYELSETISIAHDIGHTPFGHAGERVIKHYLENNMVGSFSHALQGVKVADFLCSNRALKPMGLKGLGISDYVLEGILKHDSDSFINNVASAAYKLQYECPKLYKPVGTNELEYSDDKVYIGGIETQIACWADKIAYMSHDWEEFVDVGLLEIMISRINVILIQLDHYIQNPHDTQYEHISQIEADLLHEINESFKKLKKTFYFEQYSLEYLPDDSFVSALYAFVKVLEEIIIQQEKHPTSFVLFSSEQYILLHSFSKISWAWICITKRKPESVGGKMDVMFVLYKYLCDTTAHRTVPALINLLIECSNKKIQNLKKKQKERETFIKLCNDKWEKKLSKFGISDQKPAIAKNDRDKAKIDLKKSFMVTFDKAYEEAINYISIFIHKEFIKSTRVQFMIHKAEIIIGRLLSFYHKNPQMLPLKYRNRISQEKNLPEIINHTKELLKKYYADRINEAISEDIASGCDDHSKFCQVQKIISIKFKKLIGQELKKVSDKELITEVNKAIESTNQFAVDAIELRVIADYVSGMTDRMAEKKYNEICSSSTRWSKEYTERGTFNI